MINTLTYRKLCIIRLVVLQANQEVSLNSISIKDEDIEKMPEHQRTKFHFIGRDYEELVERRIIIGTGMPTGDVNDARVNEPYLDYPYGWRVTYLTRKLHDLLCLHEIPEEDMIDFFDIWNLRFK